ncbi:chemotaxis protein CheA [Candidatus Methylospira mobilis]|uniref:Chemotaxis protein CheA n=1 Tax=Candidatus Methylospira mobilis TaxID=1808979 RepID=A0A5Q0BEW6_9GAMM|nr:chemotaxis protein CheA [Candidatus Methylospira mobilis]QFY42370.1 chemotaxis protein CheA [Candidatus Methylospira mobilis]
MNLDAALNTFITESRDLLRDMEQALLRLDTEPGNDDIINAIFRAAHTIKGSAGLFGLDFIVTFTHAAESVLDKVRDGEIDMDAGLVGLFLSVCDHEQVLIGLAANHEAPDDDVQRASDALTAKLECHLGKKPSPAEVSPAQIVAVPVTADARIEREESEMEVAANHWHLSLRFGPDILRNGMDPLAFLRYLSTLGRIVHIVTLTDFLPSASEMDPETCYLGFELALASDADKATIEGAFEFVREDSQIRILPPRSKISEYQRLIGALTSEEMRLGEILVQCGTLTRSELETMLHHQAKVRKSGENKRLLGEVLIEQNLVQPPVVDAAVEQQKKVKQSKNTENVSIRVDAQKLDQLINLIGELIIAGAGVNLFAEKAGIPELQEATSTLSRLVEDVRDSALTLRMVQIGETFNRFQRVVHDVSKDLGKDIRLVITGAETELDKTVVEKIGDPLTHLVRNSMDHGIEAADVRAAHGKPAQGTLQLHAYHDAGSIVIEVSDDGSGLNREKILRKAIERDLVKPDQALTDQEIYQLIFEPGFSTADQVSNLSGRGVGMDVVRRNIQALRGSIDLDSVEGAGTTIRVRLPLTLAIIDGFLVEVAGAAYVVPLDMVLECMELTDRDREVDVGYINLRGEVLPCIRLRELYAVEGTPPRRENVVVVQYGTHRAGFVVDRLLGEFQTVIKPMGKLFSMIKGVGGFTILGSGKVALVIDVPGVVRQVASQEAQRNAIPSLARV